MSDENAYGLSFRAVSREQLMCEHPESAKPGPWNHFCPVHRIIWCSHSRHGYLARCWLCDRAGRWTNAECCPED